MARKNRWFKPGKINLFGDDSRKYGTGWQLTITEPVEGRPRTDGQGNETAVTVDGVRYPVGTIPDTYYPLKKEVVENQEKNKSPLKPYSKGWVGRLIKAHFDHPAYADAPKVNAEQKFKDRRTALQVFSDWRSDYFIHDLQIRGNSPIIKEEGRSIPSEMKTDWRKYHSSWENQDPVIYGFEVIIDAVSSPLLNGSITDFLNQYPNVSELQSRRIVYHDFKKQFEKIFRTRGRIHYEQNYNPRPLMSDINEDSLRQSANAEVPGQRLSPGRKAYLGHYLYKIEGLDKLVESNTATENNFLVDYGKDLIKLTFTEDVSGTLSSLAHMYKLLYWSRPNGKGMVPENLLRFNCEIIISEVRNYNRIRPALSRINSNTYTDVNNLEHLRDNVSRYIYSLRECQFYFDKMPHDASIDLGGSSKTFDAFDVNFDFKYSTLKYEKWVSHESLFGRYVGYNSGAIWKIGNKGNRNATNFSVNRDDTATGGNSGTIADKSVPAFFTSDTNTTNDPGVTNIEYMPGATRIPEVPYVTPASQTTQTEEKKYENDGQDVGEDEKGKIVDKKEEETNFDKFKKWSKDKSIKVAKRTANAVIDEVNSQIRTRVQILNSTIMNIKQALGIYGIEGEPKNVYPRPYTPYGFGIYFDVRNDLYNFVGEGVSTALAGFDGVIDPYADPFNSSINPFGSLVQKFSGVPTVIKRNTVGPVRTLNQIIEKYGATPINLGKLGKG